MSHEYALFRVFSMMPAPHLSSQIKSGSVSVLEPEPSDKVDFVMSSCSASDAGTNTASSNSGVMEEEGRGSRYEMRIGIHVVISLH
jgi:hypothetical protein